MLVATLAHLNSPAIESSRRYEILIVGGGSKDDTSALALKLVSHYPQSDIRVNLGKGGASAPRKDRGCSQAVVIA
ncbi:hypothetical protein EV401DRAFT_2067822 [Pisolithus croceorrhizus]|nr:hypothetical protein EV401DRAFT_2067822 [Pisolithus croceorrhizus]